MTGPQLVEERLEGGMLASEETGRGVLLEMVPLADSRRRDGGQPDARLFALAAFGVLLLLLAASTMRAQVVVSSGGPGTVPASASPAPLPVSSPGKVRGLVTKLTTPKPNLAATSLGDYLERVRRETQSDRPADGAIWTDNGRLARLSTDVRAMRPHDLISVVVSESLAASTDGTVKNTRASNASSQISSLFGVLHAGNALQNLVNQTSAAGLNAQGQSATNSSLSTTLGGQVIEVLGNGMLVIEAARQVEFSQQTQTIMLRGLVRPEDISQQNQVFSTAISSLELEVKGKGIINDYTRRPNALVRMLEKIVIF